MGATRHKILAAAEKLLLLKGSAHVTTKEIARAVGLSESALYRHFDHKEEIFFARDLLRVGSVGRFFGIIFDRKYPGEKTAVYEIALDARDADRGMEA